tara:strand:- start:1945 stop:2610 length:666 start_codon:yes stop_codon:yes gene_type:complete
VNPVHETLADAAQSALFTDIAADIRQQGYSVQRDAVPVRLSSGLLYRLANMDTDEFQRAGTGRLQDHQLNAFVRRDRIHWLTNDNPHEQSWLTFAYNLQQFLNRELFLGLFSYECHFAHYRPGDFYKKHQDAFKGQANRILTTVLYLNPDWQTRHHGELVMYHGHGEQPELTRVLPRFGTLVVFLSEEFPHEVLAAERDRYSIAGWYRLNSSHYLRSDPPA